MTTDSTTRVDRVLLDLRTLGAAIATLDPGYPVEEATFEAGASASRIDALAALVPEPLTADYRYFLGQCAGFVGMDFHNGYVIHTPEQVMRLLGQPGAPRRVTTADGIVSVLPVGGDGGGNLFLLQLGRPHLALRWDHEIGEVRDVVPADHACFRPVAEGFVSLLERIRDDWRHFLAADPGSWTYLS